MDAKPLLFAALVKAQAKFGPALKNAVNPHFRNRYADLAACFDAVQSALNEEGIAVAQVVNSGDGLVSVETFFLHVSGEAQGFGIISLPASKNDAQGYGSSLTYARRYSLMTACGIAPEDDDGEAARNAPPPQKQAAPPPQNNSIEKLIAAFAGLGVDEKQVAEYCGKPLEKLGAGDVAKLREVYAQIRKERRFVEENQHMAAIQNEGE